MENKKTEIETKLFGMDCIKEHAFAKPERRWRADYAFPKVKILIEVEGGVWTKGRHINPLGFIKDIEKYNTATSMGWRLLRFTPQQMETDEPLEFINKILDNDKKKES